jgi:site-specific recombinase XerD
MTQASSSLDAVISNSNVEHHHTALVPTIDCIVQKISAMQLPGLEHFESYMRHKWRMNRKPNTLRGSFQAVRSFLTFYVSTGKSELRDIASDDLEVYVEHEQDRRLKVTTVKTRLNYIWAFLRFLVEQDIIGERILRRKIRLRVPNFLPRAIAPSDVRKILAAVKEARDRALVLVLLRTRMRIGELLGLKMMDLDLRGKKIHIFEGEKNSLGRVVYLSDDALMALRLWLKKRDKSREYLFYGLRNNLCYSAA